MQHNVSCNEQKVADAFEIRFGFVLPMPSNGQSAIQLQDVIPTSNAPASSRSMLPACLRPLAIADLAADILMELQWLERKDRSTTTVQQTIGLL